MKYDKWQLAILKAKGHILLNKGRQIGGTTIFAHKAANLMKSRPKVQIVVVSLTLEQAENIIKMIEDHLGKICHSMIARGKNKPTKKRIALKNGAKTISRPVGTTGHAVRSFTGDILFIDEGALMARQILVSAKPILFTTGGDIWMTSTPFGKYEGDTTKLNYFYESWLNKHDKWTIFEMDTVTVSKERPISKDWTLEQREGAIQHMKEEQEDLTTLEFGQEYLHQFADEMRQWFPDELIKDCMIQERKKEIEPNRQYFLGIDIARMGEDESTFEVFDIKQDKLYQIENQISKKTKLNETFNHIKQLHLLYKFKKIFIDSGGIGVGVFDWLMDDDATKRETIAIDNSKQIMDRDGKTRKLQKTLLYSNLKMLMEQSKLKLLKDDNIKLSLKSVQYAYTTDNMGVRHLKIFGNYTHICEGIVRAAWGWKYKDIKPWIGSIRI